jgi:hypothetical protein
MILIGVMYGSKFFPRNKPPVLSSVLTVICNNPHLPNFKISTFYLLLEELDLFVQRRGEESLSLEEKTLCTRMNCGSINIGHTVQKEWKGKS